MDLPVRTPPTHLAFICSDIGCKETKFRMPVKLVNLHSLTSGSSYMDLVLPPGKKAQQCSNYCNGKLRPTPQLLKLFPTVALLHSKPYSHQMHHVGPQTLHPRKRVK